MRFGTTGATGIADHEAARAGDRVCSLGEAPFLDLESRSRREVLCHDDFAWQEEEVV